MAQSKGLRIILNQNIKDGKDIKEYIHNKTLDNYRSWIDPLVDRKKYDGKIKDDAKEISKSFDSKITHASLIHYIYHCWANENNVVLRPDMIMFTILSEVAKCIIKFPDSVRHLYTKSDKKEPLQFNATGFNVNTVLQNCEVDILVALSKVIPNKEYLDLITNINYESAPKEFMKVVPAIFVYSATPFYGYFGCITCGIPEVIIKGSVQEWDDVRSRITKLKEFIPSIKQYLDECLESINIIIYAFAGKTDKITNILTLELTHNCMSGSAPIHIDGWITNFYMERSDYITQYNSHLAAIPFVLDDKNLLKIWGLCYSDLVDNTLEPQYGNVCYDLNKKLFDAIA